MNSYLFTGSERTDFLEPFIVEAQDLQSARYIAARNLYKHDECFLEDAFMRSMNCSFAEIFFLETDEEIDPNENEDNLPFDKKIFIERVKSYFKSKPHLAKEFIKYFLDFNESNLSEEFLIEIWVRRWCEYNIVEVESLKRLK